MRIISPFKDYYDSVLAHGQDDHGLFVRKTSVLTESLSSASLQARIDALLPDWSQAPILSAVDPRQKTSRWRSSRDRLGEYRQSFLVIAGRPHVVHTAIDLFSHFNIEASGHVGVKGVSDPAGLGVPSADRLATLLMASPRAAQVAAESRPGYQPGQSIPLLTPDTLAIRSSHGAGSSNFIQPHRQNSEEMAYDEAVGRLLQSDLSWLCSEAQTPIVMIVPSGRLPVINGSRIEKASARFGSLRGGHGALIINPRLADFGFQSVLDPFQAFQTIEQFITGVLPGATSPMITVSDKTQILKKGFDPVYGFRTRPGS